MIIDIREDLPRFRQYLVRRLSQHLDGPEKSLPVHQIVFGFEFGQQNWVALVFDTREDAAPDGEWVNMIDEADFLQNPSWPIWAELPEHEQVSFINLAGQTVNVMNDPDHLICNIVGEALKHTLISARDEGLFQSLPNAGRCELGVENLEGYYGWPDYEEREGQPRPQPETPEQAVLARASFKYFWRELSWEARRIVPALDMSVVKLPFTDGPRTDGHPDYEHMWVGEVDFDGETLSGKLLNSPKWLTSVREGDAVQAPFSHLTDWVMAANGQAYGGFTVNAMRARMSSQERKQHDKAWGLDFGDPAVVRVKIHKEEEPEKANQPDGFRDHPMCVNMLEMYDAQLNGDPTIAQGVDEAGWTLLHRDALAGNLGVVKLFVAHGADVAARTPSGRTASDLARGIGWPEIAEYLDAQPKA